MPPLCLMTGVQSISLEGDRAYGVSEGDPTGQYIDSELMENGMVRDSYHEENWLSWT